MSIQTKPAHFLPGIRTSTSEQSSRNRKNSNPSIDSSVRPPRPSDDRKRIDRHKSANAMAPSVAPPAVISHRQPPKRSETADELDEYLSDDSLQQNQPPNRSAHPSSTSTNFPGRHQHTESLSDYLIPPSHHSQLPASSFIDNSTVVSALTTDTNLQSFPSLDGSEGNGQEPKTKKKKRKVWKMEPIPIRPYVQVPATGNG